MNGRGRIPFELKTALKNHRHLGQATAFKYVRKSFLQDVLQKGILRIGSYEEFRLSESSKLRDIDEGHNSALAENQTALSEFHRDNVFLKFFNPAPGVDASTITVKGFGAVLEFDFPTFCFCYENSLEVFRSICDENNNYDAVIEISNVFAVAECVATFLSRGLQTHVSYLCLPIVYRSTTRLPHEPSPENLARAFEKPEGFAANKEGRIVFYSTTDPDNSKIKDFNGFVRVPAITPFLHETSLPFGTDRV